MGGTHKIFADIDVDGEVKGTSLDLNGNAQIDGTITVGQDDTGYDVKFFLAASGRYIMIDEDDNSLLFTDNANAKWGNGGDLQISHDGTDSRIDNMVGHLKIRNYSDDSDIIFETDNGSGSTTEYLKIDGGITSILAYKDILMANDGVNGKIKFGASQDLTIGHNGTDSQITNTTGHLQFTNTADDKDITFATDNGSGGDTEYFRLDGSSKLNVFSQNLRVEDTVQIQAGGGNDLRISHDGTNSYIDNYTGNLLIKNQTNDGDIVFYSDDGNGSEAVYFRLDGSLAGGDGAGTVFTIFPDNSRIGLGANADLRMFHDGTDSKIQNLEGDFYIMNTSNDKDIIFQSDDGSGGLGEYFRLDGSQSSASSDYRYTRWQDYSVISLGNGNDLQLWHDASNGRISNYTGDLHITQELDDKDIIFNCDDGSGGTTPYITLDGSTTNIELHKETNLRQPADSQGINIYGYDDESSSSVSLSVNSAGHATLSQTTDGSSGYLFLTAENYLQLSAGSLVYTQTQFRIYDAAALTFGDSGDSSMRHDGSNFAFVNSTGNITFTQNTDDGDIIFQSDDGSGGTATYLTIDGGSSQIEVSKSMRFADGIRARFGGGADVDIYHDGSNSYIKNATGDLYIQQNADDKDIVFQCDDGSGGSTAYLTLDGSQEAVVFGKAPHIPEYILHDGDGNTYFGFAAADTFRVGVGGTTRLDIASGIELTGNTTLTGTLNVTGNATLVGIIMDGNTITGVDDSGEFTNDDAHIMTSAAIEDKILGYSYTANGLPTTGGTMSGAIAMGNQNITGAGTITGTTLTGTSLDINGAADISGDLTGVDAFTASGKIQGAELEGTSLDINGSGDISGDLVIHGKITQSGIVDYERYGRTYTVNVNAPLPLLTSDGSALPTGGGYRVTGHISGTGTEQVAMAVFWNENGTWNINKTFEGGTSSNHVEFKLLDHGSGSVPTVTLESHTSNYNVHVYHERLALEEGTGNDNLRGYFGADSYLSWLESNNTLTIPGNVTAGSNSLTAGSLDINGNADISGDLTLSGVMDILMVDNSGAAVEFKQGSDLYMRFITTNGSEHIEVNQLMEFGAGINVGGHTISNTLIAGDTFVDDDNRWMTSAAINDRFAQINANTTGTAAIATTITVADESSDTSCNVLFATAATGNLGPKSGSNLTFNSSSGVLTATGFAGALTGNVTGNASGSSGSCTGNAATATEATSITATANNSANETVYLTFVDGATGTQGIETDTGLSYNPSTGGLTTNSILVGAGITHDGDINNKIAFTTDTQTFSCDGNESLIIRGDAVTDAPLFEIQGAGAGNQLNIGLLLKGKTNGNPIKMKMQAPNDSASVTGAGILSYEPDADTFNIGQSTTHNNMAISINNDDQATMTNVVTLSGGFVLDGNTITGVDNASEFTDNDAHIMTSTAIKNKIADNDNSFMLVSTTTTQTGTKTFSGVIDITNTTDSSNATGDTGALRCEGGASIAKKLYVGSTITGSADVIAFSDKKLKENIETLDGKKVLDMRGVSFTRKDTGAESSGVIAQEIQKVAPELVHDTEGTLGVAYGNLVGYLIEAVKDQQKQINELKEIINGSSR